MSAKKTDTSFWDASALVPLCCSQPALTVLSRRFAGQFSRKIAWWGTDVEIHSALNRLNREDKLDEKQFEKSCRRWEILSRILYFVEPGAKVKEIAKTLPETYGLRALDSFQLAAAL
ncbi:MAG TPA: type II toxin-antitoxin system VapC family toxin, partial [Pyrinomonadaceae bacterium]|nr:type II toxin-antitoxin system VapC family toxin [Pyrinomonadaceae bacterium]